MKFLNKKNLQRLLISALLLPILLGSIAAPSSASAQDASGQSSAWSRVKAMASGASLYLLNPVAGVVGVTSAAITGKSPSILDVTGTIANGIISAIGKLLTYVQKFLALFIGLLADGSIALIHMGTTVLQLPVIQIGFNVCLSFVNLIFVMALIVIAFQIILDYHASDAKSKLAKVIMGAVLINFSLLIAGFLLDISNVFTIFFLKNVTSEGLRTALNTDAFADLARVFAQNNGFQEIAIFAGQLFGVIFTGIILVILIAVFATALMRILWVAALLIVMPLTWGFWVFPGLSKYTGQWWDQFIKWGVVVLPSMTFFLYIALQATTGTAKFLGMNGNEGTFFGGIIQLLILGGLMVAGLKIGQAAGGITAGAAMGAAKKAGGWASKPLYNKYTKRWLAQPAAGKIAGISSSWAGSNNLFKQIIGKGAVMSGAASAAAGYSHIDHQLEEDMKKQYAGVGVGDRVKIAMKASTPYGKAEAFLALKEKGDDAFKKIIEQPGGAEKLKQLMGAYGEYSHENTKEILKATPALKKVLSANPEAAFAVGAVDSVAEGYQKMDTTALKEFDLKDRYQKDASGSFAKLLTSNLSKSQLATLASKSGQNETHVRFMINRSFVQNIETGGDPELADFKRTLDDLNNRLKQRVDAGDREGVIRLTARIDKEISSNRDYFEITKKDDPAFASTRDLIVKYDRLNRIGSSLAESAGSTESEEKTEKSA